MEELENIINTIPTQNDFLDIAELHAIKFKEYLMVIREIPYGFNESKKKQRVYGALEEVNASYKHILNEMLYGSF
ncbi:MAG: hypothetical protein PF450_07145 [Bacteroidales bacterium]|jgi:hypothetical protein|nr:hypothetical protein [Bacteroidales bacterium]